MDNITVLITGAGAPGAPGIIKSLRMVTERDIRIIGVDMASESSGFAMVDKWYIGEKAESKILYQGYWRYAEKRMWML